ncbi:MAG: chemotaxis protein CheX, partial [Proteobacteria bacterium]|nr:chemotaxis protein CheX [Pseudomonadota bacterium]
MKQEYVNAFLAPAALVWTKELNHDLKLVSAESVSHQFTTEDVTAIIGVSGSLQGNVLYGFNSGTALYVASQMMGEPVEELDEIGLSALGEIANMITGNAATYLANAGYAC